MTTPRRKLNCLLSALSRKAIALAEVNGVKTCLERVAKICHTWRALLLFVIWGVVFPYVFGIMSALLLGRVGRTIDELLSKESSGSAPHVFSIVLFLVPMFFLGGGIAEWKAKGTLERNARYLALFLACSFAFGFGWFSMFLDYEVLRQSGSISTLYENLPIWRKILRAFLGPAVIVFVFAARRHSLTKS